MRILLIIVFAMSLFVMPLSSDAQRPDAPQYAVRGAFPVGTMELRIEDTERPLEVTIWYPALNPDNVEESVIYQYRFLQGEGQAIRDAMPAEGPFPLVVFSHGSGGFRYQSVFYTEHLASYGFIVMAADHPGNTVFDRNTDTEALVQNFALRPIDVLRQIALADELTISQDGHFAGVIDTERIAITGHSFGGYTALAVGGAQLDFSTFSEWCSETSEDQRFCELGEHLDEIAALQDLEIAPEGLWPAPTDLRVKAIIPLAPWSPRLFSAEGLAGVTVPTMILVGSKDQTTPLETNAAVAYEHIASSVKSLVVFENADHYIFVQECTETAIEFGFFAACSDPVWDMQRVHDLTIHFATAFLLSILYEDSAAAEALAAERVDFVGVNYEISR